MKKVYIIHGYGGEPNGGWRPWLMGQLAKDEIWACALAMPMAGSPQKEKWVQKIQEEIREPNEEVFLVGHSLGVPAILNFLESLPIGSKIGGVVLVSGIIHVIPNKERYLPINHFYDKDFNYEYIKDRCKKFVIIHAKNDENVPYEQAVNLSKNLSSTLLSLESGGHLNGSSGCYELPVVLEKLKEIMN